MSHPVDAMIIGVEKAGTTSVLRYLSEHPEIVTHDVMEFPYFVKDDLYAKGYEAIYQDYFPECPQSKMLLAKNVGCIYWEEAASRMKEHNPDMKLIVVLRNPVERAYSAFWYAVQKGREDVTTFIEAINKEEERLRSGDDFDRRYHAYIARGLYAKQLGHLFNYFPREQLKVVMFDDLKINPKGVMNEIVQFLNVAEFEFNITKRHNKTTGRKSPLLTLIGPRSFVSRWRVGRYLPRNIKALIKKLLKATAGKEIVVPPMTNKDREIVQALFADDLRQLEQVLNLKSLEWRDK